MKRLGKERGITLVALVVTVIILLILAGITITLTLGDKGIINMAKEAGKNYQDAQEYEQALLGNLTNEATNIIGSDGTQSSANMGKIRILEQGTVDTGSIGAGSTKNVTINFKNSYTELDKANIIILVQERTGTIALYNSTMSTEYLIGNSVVTTVRNGAGSRKWSCNVCLLGSNWSINRTIKQSIYSY